eukprot:Rmarinus@m.9996
MAGKMFLGLSLLATISMSRAEGCMAGVTICDLNQMSMGHRCDTNGKWQEFCTPPGTKCVQGKDGVQYEDLSSFEVYECISESADLTFGGLAAGIRLLQGDGIGSGSGYHPAWFGSGNGPDETVSVVYSNPYEVWEDVYYGGVLTGKECAPGMTACASEGYTNKFHLCGAGGVWLPPICTAQGTKCVQDYRGSIRMEHLSEGEVYTCGGSYL